MNALIVFLAVAVFFQYFLVIGVFFILDKPSYGGFRTKKQLLLWLIPLALPIFYGIGVIFYWAPKKTLELFRRLE